MFREEQQVSKEAKRTMSRKEQQVSKAKKHTDGGKYGGAKNGRKREFFVSGLPLTLIEAGSFSSKDGVDWVSHKAFHDFKGKRLEVVRALPEDDTSGSGCGSYQSYGSPVLLIISCSSYGSNGGASSGYGGPAGAAIRNPTVCDASYGRGLPGPAGFWYGSAGNDCGNRSNGGASSRYGDPAVALNENPSVCNDGCGRGLPGVCKDGCGRGLPDEGT